MFRYNIDKLAQTSKNNKFDFAIIFRAKTNGGVAT